VPRIRKIARYPDGLNYFLLDANFLANRYIPTNLVGDAHERGRIEACLAWWQELDDQVRRRAARLYVPDVCIAEAFKVLAKKRFQDGIFNDQQYKAARDGLSDGMRVASRTLKARDRFIPIHDISTSRDVIIAVDRFYEVFAKKRIHVQIADLILVATAKYLMDFFDIPKAQLHIVTLDKPLRRGTRAATDLPPAYDPTEQWDTAARVFDG
jgi:hypothetical protein